MTFSAARDQFLAENYKRYTSRWPYLVKLMLTRDFKAIEHKQLEDISDTDIRRAICPSVHGRVGRRVH